MNETWLVASSWRPKVMQVLKRILASEVNLVRVELIRELNAGFFESEFQELLMPDLMLGKSLFRCLDKNLHL
jgi:hypothetical protein